MNVVCLSPLRIGLIVAKLGNEGWALDANEVLVFWIGASGPTKMDLIQAGLLDDLPTLGSDGLRHGREIGIEDRFEFSLLIALQGASVDPNGLVVFGLRFSCPLDIGGGFGVEDRFGLLVFAQTTKQCVRCLLLREQKPSPRSEFELGVTL